MHDWLILFLLIKWCWNNTLKMLLTDFLQVYLNSACVSELVVKLTMRLRMNERLTKKSWASTAPSTLRSSGTHRHRRKTSTLLISKKKVMQRILETWHTGEQESAQLLCTPKQNCRIWKRVKKLWLRKWDREILKESGLTPNVGLC